MILFLRKLGKYKAFQRIVEKKNAVFNMIYHEKQIRNYRDGIVPSGLQADLLKQLFLGLKALY